VEEAYVVCSPKFTCLATHKRKLATISVISPVSGAALLDFCLKILISYLLGSVLGSLVIGKLKGGVDIRELGSGNAGGTNALRTQGPWFAACVMLIDVGKGWVAAALIPELPILPQPTTTLFLTAWLPVTCAAAVVVGHVYPMWFGFRGGKGAATLIGVVLGLQPFAAIPTMIIWFIILMLTGYVGLATMIAAIAYPLYALWRSPDSTQLIFGAVMALFVIYTHRANISRMLDGTENRATRIWLLRPR
jgi:acyl phosphate:glycerol-3-phosphate acyltransferase